MRAGVPSWDPFHPQFRYLTRQNTVTAPADGGTTPVAPAPTPNDAAAAAAKASTGASDRGFPEGTPLEQMNVEQQLAYWKHHSRKHEDQVKAFKGVTPDKIAEYEARIGELESEKLTADERALQTAKQEAADAASAAAKAKYLPRIQTLEVKALASTVFGEDTERLKAFMDVADPSKFLGEDGQVDESKVMGHLTAMFGQPSRGPQIQQPRWQNAGQFSPPAPRPAPGAAGRAEAQKRSGKKTT